MQMTQLTGHCPTQYEADEEALSEPQRDQIEHSAPKLQGGTIPALFSSKRMSACLARIGSPR